MTTTTTTCDRCHRRCDASASLLALKAPGQADYATDLEICPGCHAELAEWLDAGRAHVELGPTPPADPLTAACSS